MNIECKPINRFICYLFTDDSGVNGYQTDNGSQISLLIIVVSAFVLTVGVILVVAKWRCRPRASSETSVISDREVIPSIAERDPNKVDINPDETIDGDKIEKMKPNAKPSRSEEECSTKTQGIVAI